MIEGNHTRHISWRPRLNIAQNHVFEEVIVQGLSAESEQEILSCLPANLSLEATAKETKALVRRREITRAVDLLRMVFAYSVCDWSLRTVGAWCLIVGIGNLSDVAVLQRLRRSHLWMGKLVAAALRTQQLGIFQQPGVRLRIMDGSSLSQPGSAGTDWRIHVSLDLGTNCIDGVELTDAKTGESFANVPTNQDDIRVGDRGYAYPKGILSVLKADGKVIVRANWHNLSLENDEGNKICLIGLLSPTDSYAYQEHSLWLRADQERFAVRLIIARLPQEAADKARNSLYRKHRKKGTPLSENTLLAAGYVFILANLSVEKWTAQDILKIYRFRWQIELAIKRLKSILHIDQIRSQCPELTQVYILAKLLAALMIDQWIRTIQASFPQWFIEKRPISIWRLTILFYESIADAVRGLITAPMILRALPKLHRFLCEPPRLRKQQLAFAKNFLTKFTPLS
jgi:hypothetical protein